MSEGQPSQPSGPNQHCPSRGSDVGVRESDLVIEPASLVFGEDSRQVPVDTPLQRELVLSNNTNDCDIYAEVAHVEDPRSGFKYCVSFGREMPIVVKAGKNEKVMITLTISCTTEVDTQVSIKTWKADDRRYKRVLMPIKIESRLSSKIDPDKLRRGAVIVENSRAIVHRGEFLGRQVAIKTLKCELLPKEFKAEVTALEALHHESIVNFIGAVHFPRQYCIVTELAPFGSLYDAMRSHRQEFSETLKVKCLLDISSAIDYLHQASIVHRDLKPANILIVSLDPNSHVCAKLSDFGTDFGISRSFDNNKADDHATYIGTDYWAAPEVWNRMEYGKPVDAYSFALVAYTLFSGRCPHEERDNIVPFLLSGKRPGIPSSCPIQITQLISKCWSPDPVRRPPFQQIHQFFQRFYEGYRERRDVLQNRAAIPDQPVQLRFRSYGDATQRDGAFVLTLNKFNQRGSVWAPLPKDTFTTRAIVVDFTFQITEWFFLWAADGFAFVLQAERENALGEKGEGIGYSGIRNCVAVEFDTNKNGDEPNGNHVSINSNGAAPNTSNHSASRCCNTAVPTLNDGRPHQVRVAINPVIADEAAPTRFRMYVTMDGQIILQSPELPYAPLISTEGLWIGFTAATGGGYQKHIIRNVTVTAKAPQPHSTIF